MGKLLRSGEVEAFAAAPPEVVWPIVADLTRIGEWSHECGRVEYVGGAAAAAPGVQFRGDNHVGRVNWSRVSEFVAVDAPKVLAWRTIPTWRYPDSTEWRIELEPVDGGTRLVQRFEVLKLNPVFDWLIWRFVPVHRDRREALAGDLERLAALATSEVSSRSGGASG
jgi:hypothetical protein